MLHLQLVSHDTGEAVHFPGGGTYEADLVRLLDDAITKAIIEQTLARGVGFFKTQAHVEADLRAALADVVEPAVRKAFYTFKAGYRPSLS